MLNTNFNYVLDSYDGKASLGQPIFPVLTRHTKIKDLIGCKSWLMFSFFDDTDWLTKPVSTWKSDAGYLEMLYYLSHLKIVNDAAERAIKLMYDFNDCLTKDEEQQQYLYQVVEDHRKKLSHVTKQKLKLLKIN